MKESSVSKTFIHFSKVPLVKDEISLKIISCKS